MMIFIFVRSLHYWSGHQVFSTENIIYNLNLLKTVKIEVTSIMYMQCYLVHLDDTIMIYIRYSTFIHSTFIQIYIHVYGWFHTVWT